MVTKLVKEKIFVDTSFFFALISEKDEFHEEAVRVWQKISTGKPIVVITNYILDETFTLIRKRKGLEKVLEFREVFIENAPDLRTVRVSANDEEKAWKFFEVEWSDLSYTDCTSFAVMKRLGLERVATFDEHFSRAGFKIVK